MLVNGTWFDDDCLPADRGGAFVRPDSSFRDRVLSAIAFLVSYAREGPEAVDKEAGHRRRIVGTAARTFQKTRIDGNGMINSSADLRNDMPTPGDSAQHLAIMQARNKAFRWPKGDSGRAPLARFITRGV